MFCKKCGEQLKEGAKFCAVCGTPVQQTNGANFAQQNGSVNTGTPSQAAYAAQPAQQVTPNQPVQQAQPVQQQPVQRVQQQPVQQPQRVQQPVDQGTQAQGAAVQQPHYVTYPPNWVGSLAMLPNFKMCMTKKYAKFSGRATRAEYFRYVIASSVIGLLINNIISLVTSDFVVSYIGMMVVSLIFLLPGLGVTVRRLHDSGRSGFWVLGMFIPLLNIVVFIFTLLSSVPGPNQYGPLPDYTYYEG
ncbi:MAG: DUF805 domain-containing protein [Veillonella sp.]|uniref:DUF805 domain-containing protein n=1 Tax=Veillonella sp. TaxID=1926307 RepID=UPI0025E74FE5|nr:DUF805 domain-containing protein [Veillonella sp.]MBS4913148.1 DUF805 domain-containing protein [Veillonella sp.]